MSTLAETLDRLTHPGELFEKLEDGAVRCYACGHRCLIRPGRRGICQVRFNQEGELRVPWGYVAGLQVDPVEKKPFYHLLAGSDVLSFGMLGCDFHCDYCQNWLSSQALRDPASEVAGGAIRRITPQQLVRYGVQGGAQLVASTYNEPLITAEWAVAIFKLAQEAGLRCAFVSNGNATPEVLEYLRPYLTAYKIDLKTMQDAQYRQLGGVLQNVLDTIQRAHALGLWVEIVTLVVPGFNDSTTELMDTARFICSVSPDIPWHVTAFHPDYKRSNSGRTPSETLERAAEIGLEAGLRYVYAGNLPGQLAEYEHTCCHNCRMRLIERYGFIIMDYRLTAQGTCPQCGTRIPGVWTDDLSSVRLGGPGMPRWIGF
ncbi:MAG: AmmeMemoRadiSam system radical SAM enzyme [Anaerolineales bacterium]|nr:AmmeMemoRadiSam system radical SAM enzyme [Anaerolineales bacterium]